MIFRQKPPDLTPGKKPSMRELRLYELRKSKPFFIDVALEYKKMIDSGEVASQAELARKFGLSRARVTQVLNVIKKKIANGDLSQDITPRSERDNLGRSFYNITTSIRESTNKLINSEAKFKI